MCGIVGIVGKEEVVPLLLSGLKRLEYRGYDSAGIAVANNGMIERCRAKGKISNLEKKLEKTTLSSHIGIAHTRWATHGIPNEANAHPHATDKVAVVHNGIIENFQELRDELTKQGYEFESDTDTEVVAHLITQNLNNGMKPKEATFKTLQKLQGAFALGILFVDYPNMLIAARQGSPLAIGYGDGEMYLGSDALALAHLTKKISYLEDGDWAVITQNEVLIYDKDDTNVERPITTSAASGAIIGKGEYRHFMLKEIYEQPQVIGDTLNGMFNPITRTITMPEMPFEFKNINRITIIACGTSYYAAMTAKYWIEKYARIAVEVDLASEFRYRKPVMPEGGLALFISQSGETADTLAALKYCKEQKQHTLAIVNVTESTIAREADAILHTLAGPEIGVASTKAFTTQLVTLACLTMAIGKTKGTICHETEEELTLAISELPAHIVEVLNHSDEIEQIAHQISEARDVLYLGRGTSYPIALEGALKLKEISYIHAEGYAAGELKHGPIALIDEDVPVIVVAPHNELFEKTASNVLEVVARGGKVILLSDLNGIKKLTNDEIECILMPEVSDFVTPILYSIPVQLLAYYTAVIKGTDVDQPRNLAKSVTVE